MVGLCEKGRSYRVLGILLVSIVFAAKAFAQNIPDYGGMQRLCQQEDLAGRVFVLVDFRETPPGKETRWQHHFRYDYLHFTINSYYYEIANNRGVQTKAQAESMLGVPPGRYTLSSDGVISFIRDDKILSTYRCITILKPRNEYITGDIILTGYTRKRQSELYKLYRRWY